MLATRIWGALHWRQNGIPSATGVPHFGQGCSTGFQVTAAGSTVAMSPRVTAGGAAPHGIKHTGLNRVFLASGLNVYQGEIRAFALRLNGDDVLVGLGADFQFYRAAVIALVAAQGL
jgi:hypothetical protein